jgi:AraC family transcriptional regulator
MVVLENYKLWQLKPDIKFYIHHENLENFVRPVTQTPHWTLMITRSGSFSYKHDSNKGHISGECLYLCPPGKNLYRRIITPLTFDYMRLDFFYPDGRCANNNSEIPIGKTTILNTGRMHYNSFYLQILSTRGDDLSKYWMNHIAYDMWLTYCTEILGMDMPFEMHSTDTVMNNSVQLIKKYASEGTNIKSIALMLGLSPVQYTRRFKAAFNINPSEYLAALRIQMVQRLLIETDMPLSLIAEKTGYQNEYYLSRVFTQTTGINPSKYRKINKLY